jgi:hypothetical protein
LVAILISCKEITKEAFGPNSKSVTLKLSDSLQLLCNETYNADMHSVTYDVDFKLIDSKNDTFNLGKGSFGDTTWKNNLRVSKLGSFYLLPVKDFSYLKLLLTSVDKTKKTDTILSPHNLRYDTTWQTKTDDIPTWVYAGSSTLDTIFENKIVIYFEYRIGDYEPFKFYTQKIAYEIDTVNGVLLTKDVYERKAK